MKHKWTRELETGNQNIGEQNKQLFTTLNELISVCQADLSNDIIEKSEYFIVSYSARDFAGEAEKTMDFLVDYTSRHFSDEETFQIKHNYPKYRQHKQLHDDFKSVVSNLAGRMRK